RPIDRRVTHDRVRAALLLGLTDELALRRIHAGLRILHQLLLAQNGLVGGVRRDGEQQGAERGEQPVHERTRSGRATMGQPRSTTKNSIARPATAKRLFCLSVPYHIRGVTMGYAVHKNPCKPCPTAPPVPLESGLKIHRAHAHRGPIPLLCTARNSLTSLRNSFGAASGSFCLLRRKSAD